MNTRTWTMRSSRRTSQSIPPIIFIWISYILSPSVAVHVLHDGNWNLPRPTIPDSGDVQVFVGNQTIQNHFHRMYIEKDFVLIGARNIVYNASLLTFMESRSLTWYSNAMDVQMCLLKQKTVEECQNYIRVIIGSGKDQLLICGTNAFRPLCRTYSPDKFQKRGCSVATDESSGSFFCEESGVARCPYDPTHNSSAAYAGDRLFFATVADVSARDSLIFSSPLRTEQHDSQWLNDPDFVSSYEFGDKVYFFFREMAVENINCGKAVFSRVARVCTNDRGGERVLRNTWTSFFKARLNCSLPGEFPFYFDEIQSTSELGSGSVFPTLILNDRVPMVYGVFTTPRNSLRGSAICAYRFSDIVATFEGPFKEQKTAYSNWLPVREADVPNPHPAKFCLNDTYTLSDQMLNFIKWHPLMDRAVPAFGGQPIIVQSSFNFSFTHVAVDWQVYAADHRYYDVLFIGTDDGHVVKVINRGRGQNIETEVIEILEVFPDGAPVIDLKIYQNPLKHLRKLVVLSAVEMRSLPLHRCKLKLSCSACIALKDPYCSWINNECVNSDLGLQSIETGRHARCPPEDAAIETATVTRGSGGGENSLPRPGCLPCPCSHHSTETMQATSGPCHEAAAAAKSTDGYYSPSSLALATVLSILFSLIAGFIVGYVVARKQLKIVYRFWHKDAIGLSSSRNHEKIQNPYEVDDSLHHTCNEHCSAVTNGKPCNIELKENNGIIRVNSVDRQKPNIVHL